MKLPVPYKINLSLTIFLLLCFSPAAFSQLTGAKNIPGDYSTITAAVAALNSSGVGTGGVTFNVAANYTETISSTLSLTATGTVTNPILFQRAPSGSGANPLLTAYTGGVGTPATALQDGIWRLVGADYVTINAIDVKENAANTTVATTMEYGYGLYKGSTSNGCQNVTIQNCVITLSNINNTAGIAPMTDGSAGIIVMNALYATATTAVIPVSSAGTNSNNKFYKNTIQNCNTGIALIGFVAASPFTLADTNNDVGGNALSTGNTIINFGGATSATTAAVAVTTTAQYGLNISYNTINNNNGSGTNHPNTLRGIYTNAAQSANETVTYNTITISGGGTTQIITGIENIAGTTAAGNTINISNNSIINGTYNTSTTGNFYGIFNNGAAPATLTINNNTLAGNSTASATAVYYPIYNTGSVTAAININSNNIGTSVLPAVTFTIANAGTQLFINNTAGSNTAALSISNNNFYNVVYAATGTGSNTYISNSAPTLSQAINSNTFTNLNVNTAGNITFISNSVVVPATGTQNVNGNSIAGTFTKAASGIVTLFTSAASSATGSVNNNNNNNFSNITLTGATVMNGWVNTDGGGSTKTISGNTFSNWVAGTGAVNAMNINLSGTNNATTGNIINAISGAGTIAGITTAAGNDNIYSNTIYGLSTTGAAAVNGIAITSGTTKNIYSNKIYDLQAGIVGGTVNGIITSGSSLVNANIYNNLIGDLRTPASSATDPVRGISIISFTTSSTINVYNNTVYLNATSSGATFGTSGIYHSTSATATTAALSLRNNIVINTSTPNGGGLTVAYRRSSTALNNYAAASNNNLFYAGPASANRAIFYDGNADQTLATYKTRVSPRDAQSITEDLITNANFLSTSGASVSFLHLNPAKATQAESGGINITGFTKDVDGQTRQGATGYSGTGSAPDMGADEFEGVKLNGLSGTYNVGAGQTYASLTNAGGLFAAINTLGLAGNIVVNVTSDLAEDGSNNLYQWAEQGTGNYTVTIQPNSATAKIISGNVLTGLIRFNGAVRVTIDGRYSGSGNYLTFRNTNTAGTTGTAFTFINGASANTIRYCTIEAYANATNGVILFSTSTITGGNSNNVISNCNINATVSSNTGIVGIYSAGTSTAGFLNSANTISNNAIYNYRDRGLDITSTGSAAWTISGNSFYNGDVTGTIDYAAATTLHGIRVLGGAGYAILNNFIGGNAGGASGTAAVYSSTTGLLTYQGILLTTTSATPVSNIKGNTIANLSVAAVPTSTATSGTNVFFGIETNGSGINIGGSGVGEGNKIGSNTANGSIVITTSTATTNKSNIRGINCNSTGGLISGNLVGGIDISNIGTAPGPSTLYGVYINNATPPSQVNNNIIGSTGTGAASNSIRVLAGSASTTTSLNGIYISGAVTAALLLNGNIIQNISYQKTTASGNITGISNAAIAPAAITITNNTVTANATSASSGGVYGIYSNSAPASLTISNNTISGNANTITSTGLLYGIYTAGAPGAITINNNIFSGNTTAATSSGGFAGINSAATPATLTITGNTFHSNATAALTVAFYPVINTGAVTTTIAINSNNIGTSTLPAITYNAANSGSQIFISNTGGTATTALSISNNNFGGINYAVAGTGANTFISNSATTLSQTINGNTFTNLNVNTSGAITFIADNVIVPATGTQSVNNNSIVGTFTKRATGAVTLFNSTVTSATGSVITNSNNNFSNITVTGTTQIAGWINTDAGSSSKTISNNTFSNWVAATGSVTALTVNLAGTNTVAGNAINNISSAAAITGITTGTGNNNVFANTINTLSTTGAVPVAAISVTGGTTQNIYKNKIYDLQANNASGTVNGILVSGTTIITANIYNNLVGDLRTPVASATDPVRGISITATTAGSTNNVYFNTIYLNASSTGANFGTSAIYHTANATSTIASLNLRNNSITNTSTPRGTGLTVAYRRAGTALNNYALTSNNNAYYAGTPGATRLIFYDGTNADQTLAAFKSRVAARDAASVTENITTKFLSTAGSSSVYLHMDATQPTILESGAVNITGFTDDFDGQVRAGNSGYTGSSTTPDIGADEIFGIEVIPPVITYTPLANTTSTVNRAVTGVVITDASGINNNAGTKPRIYFKRYSDANVWLDNTANTNGWKYSEATNTTSPYTFTINYSLLYDGAANTAGAIQYFIVAQDLATIANLAINSGSFATPPTSVALTSTAFPITGTINSYTIPYSGSYNIGTGEVFTSLTKADGLFASINTAGLMGNATFNITTDITEDGTNALAQWTESGAGNYTVTIQPDAATVRTISGNVAAGLIRLAGADRVIIDGRYSGEGSFLSFKNTATGGTTGTAFTFANGATNNAIKNCDVQAYANATNGVILFSTSATAGGNSNNLIDSCTINATVAFYTGAVAIYSGGTVGYENAGNTISNNSIYNYRDRGLDISATGSTAWAISGNSFYNGDVTSGINYASSSTLHGIRVLGGSGYAILDNFIGGSDVKASGANAVYSSTLGNLSFTGILLTTSSATPASNVKGNTIAATSILSVPTAANSASFTGIETAGSGINIGGSNPADGNIIGSGTANGSITVTTTTASLLNTSKIIGINCISNGGFIINNQVGGFDINNAGSSPAPSAFQGVFVNNTAAPAQVNSNTIGSIATPNNIRVLAGSLSGTTSLTGIETGTAVNNAVQINSNRIDNISNLSTTSSGSFTGINNTATLSGAVITISGDTVQNIFTAVNANVGSTVYSGISSASASTITNSFINNIALSSSGVNAQIVGVNVSGPYATTVSGNIISNFSTVSNKINANIETGSPSTSAIIGILNSTTAAGQLISNNRLAGFSAISTAGNNVMVTGLAITATGSGNIFNNRFGTMVNLATGAAPGLCHIMAASGSFNVYNNTLRISNLANTNGIKVYGIIHASATPWNYFHNTVRVGGASNGTALRSAAFLLSGSGSPVLKNNILFNIRSGTGSNYSVSNLSSPPATWLASTSNYNDIFSNNPTTVGEWGSGSSKTFAQWQAVSGGDANSISNAISFITSTYDLEPDSVTNCNFNNAGIPITSPVVIASDINSISRSTINPDLGAYEFNYTGFVITANNNSPVCSGDIVTLNVNPGGAISPSYSWRNPANAIVSAIQNPMVTPQSGYYKITVTDSTGCYITDSTLVAINARPTATITSVTSLCDSGLVNLNIAVTGTGVISGTLSNGDVFSGTAPLLVVPVYISATTSFSITDLTDGSCTSIPTDIPDTVTVSVTHKGDWLGITSNWADPVNWCGGILPTATMDVTIPVGTLIMPIVNSSVSCNSLTISLGDTLTIAGTGTLNIAGTLTAYGTYKDNGTTVFNGTSGQQTFSGVTTFNNVTLTNTSGLLLPASVAVKNNVTITGGTLTANDFNIAMAGNWSNNASLTAFAGGAGTVTFNGTAAQSIGGSFATTFNHLTLSNGAGSVSLASTINIAGNLSVAAGTFDLGAFTANRTTAGGALTVANNATLKIGGTNTFPTNYTLNNLVVASTVEYSGTAQTVANQTYGNLKVSSASGVAVKTFPATALTILGNLISTVGTGTSVSFTAASNITVNGNVSLGTATIFNGGSYSHTIGGSWINSGTFTGNTSTVIFNGAGAAVDGTGTQNFNHLTVAASGVSFSAATITLTGNLNTTASGSILQASGGTFVMNGTAKTISGSGISLNNLTVNGSVTTATSFILSGNLAVSGNLSASSGTITMSGTAKTISGSGVMTFYVLNSIGSITTATNFSIGSALLVNGSFTASGGTATFTGTSFLSGTANLFNSTLVGTSLQLATGSVFGIANALTIASGSLDVSTSAPNTVNFNGTGAQNINSITYSNLLLSNGGIKTATGAITTAFDLTIGTGTTFAPSTYTHTVYGDWFNNGAFTAGTSTVQFLGPQTSNITGATTFNILTENKNIVLKSNVSAATVNMTSGTMQTGTNILTITGTRTGGAIIIGTIRRNHVFTTGVAYAFEGLNNTITFSSVSSVSSVTVSVVKGSISDFPFGGSVSRRYTIDVPAGTYTADLRLHYEDVELNANNESSMALWQYSGSAWSPIGKTANDTVANYVEQTGLTNITNRWTLSDNSNVVQWNGNVSSDWNTAANWTLVQGSASTPPSANDIANIGNGSFTYQPTISTAVNVKGVNFGSAQAVTLTMAAGGSLTTGSIKGTWTTNATHTINVNNQAITTNGGLVLSDGVNGHAINLNIGSGLVNVFGSVNQSGGANIVFTGAGNLNISNNFNYTNGTFTAGTGTVTYNGSINQTVAAVAYNNFTVNKTGGVAAINNTTNIAGDLLVSAGELDNYSTTTVAGNVTINAAGILKDFLALHVQGNWNNTGTYTASGASIYFDGSGQQNISASTFNNLNINKPSGTATLMGNVSVTGDLTISSGIFDIQAYSFDRNLPGGTATTLNGATFMIGADNPPRNFTNNIIGPSSTTILYGPTPVFIGLAGITFGNLIFRGTGLKTVLSAMTVNGDLTIENTSTLDATSATITVNGNWVNSGTFIPSSSTLVFGGTSKTITGTTTFNKATATGSYTFLSNMTFNDLLTITSTGSLSAGSTILTTLNGDLLNSGILYNLGTTTFTGTILQTLSLINAVQTVALTVNFNGTVSPVLNSTSAPQYGFLNINNTGGINASVGYNILYALTVGSGASFNGGPSTHNILGSVINNGTITSSGTLNFLPATPATLNLGSAFSSTGIVVFGGAGAITLGGTPGSLRNVVIANTNATGVTPSSAWNITNNFTVNSGSIFNAGSYSHLIGGNLLNGGTINKGTSTITLNGAGIQDVNSTSAFNNLAINKATGYVKMGSNATVNGVLNFIAGNIQTGSNVIILPASGTLTGAAQNTGWVAGKLQKNIGSGATAKTFEVGDSTNYTPLAIQFANVITGGDLTASSTAGDHPAIGSSPINSSKSVNRYWTLTNGGITFTAYTATYNFAAADVDAGAATSSFGVGLYNGATWVMPGIASPNATNIQATGVTSFGDFAIGEVCYAGTTISYPASPYCSSGGVIAVTKSGTTGGTFSSAAGLSLNATTGAVTLATSTAGTYTVTYTIAASGGCKTYTTTATITITKQPFANGYYAGNPYCATTGIAFPTGTTVGAVGTLSSTPGLSIDPSNGVVDLAASTPGAYMVTYTVPASGGCAVYTTTTPIQIFRLIDNEIDFTNGLHGVVCGTAGENGSATLTAPAGTVFLKVDFASYGSPGGSCSAFTMGACHAVTSQPVAEDYLLGNNTAAIPAINAMFGDPCYGTVKQLYVQATYTQPVCSGTVPGTITGTTPGGGSGTYTYLWERSTIGATSGFSAAPGTNNTKDYIPAALTQTTWYRRTVFSGGCSNVSKVIEVMVTLAPSASISYAGSPYCSNAGTAVVTSTGTPDGIFSSTTGLSINSTTGDINLSSSTPGAYTITYTVDASGGCSVYQATATVTILSPGTWSGTVNTDWNESGNWLCNVLPTATSNITIPGSLTNYPILGTGTGSVQNITIQSGASLTVADAVLQVSGSITNNGTFNAGTGTLEMNGASAQTIPAATFTGNTIAGLIINNAAGVTLGGALNILDVVTVSNGSLSTGGYLTLKSTATATARIAPVTSAAATPISGNVTVERYIPGRRRYRLITSPVTTSSNAVLTAGEEALSIWGAWQNSGNNAAPNTGTIITGGSTANGFDPQTSNASLYTYNDATRLFTGFTSANGKATKYTSIKAGIAYYMFVYGDRTNTITTSSPNNTTLKATGTLLTGDQAYTTGSSIPLSGVTGRYTLLGNPFASPINWATMPKTDIENTYWGWDPNLSGTGGYITVTTLGGVTLQAPFSGTTGLTQHIQSGQGFFVRTSGPSPALTIREQDKVSNFNASAFRTTAAPMPVLAINLQYPGGGSKILADGVMAVFDAFSNKIDGNDATKMESTAENISIVNDTTLLSIDARQLPQSTDTLFLAVARLTKPQYTLQIFAQQMESTGVQAYLDDKYLNTHEPLLLNDMNYINFNVTPGVPASSAANRFRIVFSSSVTLPINYTSIKAAQKGTEVQVNWKVAQESGVKKYEIERSADAITYKKQGAVTATGNNSNESYQWLDVAPVTGNNYYRIRALKVDGTSSLSKTVLININAAKPVLKVFPNPVKDQQINIEVSGLQRGKYTLLLYNNGGQQIINRVFNHSGGLFNQVIHADKILSNGMYYLQLIKDKDKYEQTIFIE